MRTLKGIVLAGGLLLAAGSSTMAQPPPGGGSGGRGPGDADAFMARMMNFDKDKDGSLTRDEMTDERLQPLFDRADANKDGTVSNEELRTLYARESATRGPGGPGPGGRGPGGPGGPGGRPGRPGQVLSSFVQDRLGLADDQKEKLAALQKEVDGKLEEILTDDQKKQLKEMAERGPGGGGPPPPGGPGGGGPRRP